MKPSIKKPKIMVVKRGADSIAQAAQPDHKVRYRTKPAHAAAVRNRSLKKYRKSQESFELAGNTVLRSLDCLDDYAETIVVRNTITGKTAQARVIRLTVLAQLLNTSYQTVWRWTSVTEQLPEPVLVSSLDRERPVYHVDEVRIIVAAVGDHLNEFRYYRKDHTGTRDRISYEIQQLRQQQFGDNTNDAQTPSSRKTPRKIPGKVRRP